MNIVLTEDNLDALLQLAPAYEPAEIAAILGVDVDLFLKEWNNEQSEIRQVYKRGVLQARAKIDLDTINKASGGNFTEKQRFDRNIREKRIRDVKREIHSEAPGSISYGDVQRFIEEGKLKHVPADIQHYIDLLDIARGLFNKHSRSYIVKALQLKDKKLSTYKASQIYYDAINFFNLDNSVRKSSWMQVLLNDLQNAKLMAWEMNDMETYRRCVGDMKNMIDEIYKDEDNLPDDLFDRRIVVYSMKAEDMGIQSANRNELARLIDGFDVSAKDKERLKRDAGVKPRSLSEDIGYEEVD